MKITTENDVIRAIRQLAEDKLDPKSLSKSEQNLIIEYLRFEENWSQSKIAQLIDLVTDTIRARIRKIETAYRNALIARGTDVWTILAEVQRKKSIVQQKAAQKGNWQLVWKSETDYVAMLLTLGLIKESDPLIASQEDDLEGIDAKTLRKLYEKAKTKEQNKTPRAKAKNRA